MVRRRRRGQEARHGEAGRTHRLARRPDDAEEPATALVVSVSTAEPTAVLVVSVSVSVSAADVIAVGGRGGLEVQWLYCREVWT